MKRVIISSKLSQINDRTYVEDLGSGLYLNIRQTYQDSYNYDKGQYLWDLSDGYNFIDSGVHGWDTPEAARTDFYFRHPEFN